MTPTIWEFKPYDLSGNIGIAYNEYCKIVPDNSWICLWDCDVMVLTPYHQHRFIQYINKYQDVGMFTCYTNRVGDRRQTYPGMFDNYDIREHRKLALTLDKGEISTKKMGIISGYMMLFNKSTWKLVGGFVENNILGVDSDFSRKVLKFGKSILLMETIYCFHYYRFNEGVRNVKHLTKRPNFE